MKYPSFINKNDTIGICAPSAGAGNKLEKYEESLEVLRSHGYRIKETASVRNDNVRSTTARKRAKELDELITDPKVKAVLCAKGGDFMLEMMPYVDFDHIRDNPKWISGMSDPTNLLFTVTTGLDIATLYGFNGAGFVKKEDRSQRTFFKYLEGEIVPQKSYKKYMSFLDIITEQEVYGDVEWIGRNATQFEGRLIGGCIEVIAKLIGTSFDHTNEFIERYKDDGIVWYFDIFDMSSYNYYLTLLQMRNAGWFRCCKGVIVGRAAFPKVEDKKLDYIKATSKVFQKIPQICDADLGHTFPGMTLINGALARVSYEEGKGKISFKLK